MPFHCRIEAASQKTKLNIMFILPDQNLCRFFNIHEIDLHVKVGQTDHHLNNKVKFKHLITFLCLKKNWNDYKPLTGF